MHGKQLEDDGARSNHAAGGVEVPFYDNAPYRRTNLDARDHVLRGVNLLGNVVQLGLGFSQFLDRLLDCRRVQMRDPLVGARDAFIRIRDAPSELAEIACQRRL